MMKRVALLLMALALAVPAWAQAPGSVNFSGTWKLAKTDPPPTGRGRGRGRGNAEAEEGGGGGGSRALEAVPTTIVMNQSGNELTFESTMTDGYVTRLLFKLDFTQNVQPLPPGGDGGEPRLNGPQKTKGRWDTDKLYLYLNQGIGQRRDILSLSGGVLTIRRDSETPGGSGTVTLTFTKVS